jgi:CHAD domain-containing protein
MPYRLKLDEDVRKAFRRIAREQVDLALAELAADPVSASCVHASRKALKRLRALISAATPALGAKAARKHDKAIRDTARLLSRRRDADVSLDTLSQLETHFGSQAVEILRPLRKHLEASSAAIGNPFDAEAVAAVRELLATAGKALVKARFDGRLDTIMQGVEASYRTGRSARTKAYAKPSDERFHALRKSVQVHWRQMALLSRAWPEEFAVRVAAARELSQLLGDDHDTAVLKLSAHSLPGADRSIICKLCERRQQELRDAVYFRAERLYCEKPPAFGRRITACWNAGRHIKAFVQSEPSAAAPDRTSREPKLPVNEGSQPRLTAKVPASARSPRRV